jgi:hypothetical protein
MYLQNKITSKGSLMDNPFQNLDYKRWFNMIAVASFLIFSICLGGIVGIYTPNDLLLIKNIMSISIGLFFISVGEISCKKIVPNDEIGEIHHVNPLTGESWGKMSNVKISRGKKEIRIWTAPGIIFYLIGLGFLFSSILK